MSYYEPTVVGFDDSVLDRMVIAVERVKERLRRTTSALAQANVEYAVAGECAVAKWVSTVDSAAVRNCVQVELLVHRVDSETIRQALESVGFEHRIVNDVDLFIDGPHGKIREAVRLFFTHERVRPTDEQPSPDLTRAIDAGQFRLIDLGSLVTMLLTSIRNRDHMHLRDLIEVGLVDDSWLPKLPPTLAARLKTILETPEG